MNNDGAATVIGAIIVIAALAAIVIGGIKTFRRNWIAAILLLVFLTPIWVIWAVIECFRGPVTSSEVQIGGGGQNLTVTVVNQTGETSSKHAIIQTDGSRPYVRQLEVNGGGGGVTPVMLRSASDTLAVADMKICPHCAEEIRKNAKICRYCTRDV